MFWEREFEAVAERYGRELYRYCFSRLSSDKDAADEVINDVLLTLYKKWERLDRGEHLRAWLYRTADYCIRHHRSRKKKYYDRHVSLEQSYEGEHSASYEVDFLACFDEGERIRQIEEALGEEERKLFRLRFLEKKTISELAQTVGMPYSTLRLRLARVEETVRKLIRDGN